MWVWTPIPLSTPQTLTLVQCVLMFVSTQGLLARFASQAGLWQKAVKGMSELDALMALGYAAQFGGDGAPMCRPTFLDPQTLSASQPAHVSMPVEEAKAIHGYMFFCTH
jgi:hypothetical protein